MVVPFLLFQNWRILFEIEIDIEITENEINNKLEEQFQLTSRGNYI